MKKTQNDSHGFPKNEYNNHAWIIGDVRIGEDVWIGAFTLIDGKHAKLTIGKGCNIASGAQILTHSTVRRTVSERKLPLDAAPVEIGDYCFVGANAVILMGSTIGHHSVIGAGCVVAQGTKIPPYSIVTGVPGNVTGDSHAYFNKHS